MGDGVQADGRVAVIGLGYVGLPLAVALARAMPVVGIDINAERVGELRAGHDRTNEVDAATLAASPIVYSTDIADARGASVYIVTVPTPVDDANQPDLRPVMGATRAIAGVLEAGAGTIVVYESTVYPGVTEEVCGPELERLSGLKRGVDFFLGYSPERINPGDREHTVDRIIKVIAGENRDVVEALAKLYGAATTGGVFRAASIKAAEAAKVIENAQRDINIAFMNEITQIFQKLDISVYDVLEAAGTKWNFLKFQPGLVGGHCIGVDPYYLSYRAQQVGHLPRVILAGRAINDTMGNYVADQVHSRLGRACDVLVLGLTFKEDVPDLRNSKVADVIRRLQWIGHNVTVHDPHADAAEAVHEYGLTLDPGALERRYDAVVAAVAHAPYRTMGAPEIAGLLRPGGLVADVKGMWRGVDLPEGVRRWQLLTGELAGATRLALRRMAKSVCVISSLHDGRRYAMAATAADVVSLDPPSMVVSVNASASLHPALEAGADFCVNILSGDQEAVARAAGGGLRGEARFTVGAWSDGPLGLPWLDDAEANILCHRETGLRYGTHQLFVGRVFAVRVGAKPVSPLVYFDGRYAAVPAAAVAQEDPL